MKQVFRLSTLKDDRGGITFVEVLATFVIIVFGVIATAYSMYVGNRALRVDLHKEQILHLVEQEMEYWVGRLYTGTANDPNVFELAGSPNKPYKTVILDQETGKEIQVRLYYDPIVLRINLTNPESTYYVVTVWAQWTENDGEDFTRLNGKAVKLTTYVSRAT